MHSPITAQTRLTTQTMRATVYTDYGLPRDVLRMTEVERPVPDADGLLVKVHATSVNALDWRLITGTPFLARISDGIRKPSRHIPGADISGTIEAVGADVDGFSPGDEVFAEIPGGGFAEYVAVAADKVAPKPTNLGFEESATLGVAALTALQGLRDWGNLQPGQSVLSQRSLGGRGHLRNSDRQSPGSVGDNRGLQHGQGGDRPNAGSRPCHRLHPGGLHQGGRRPRPPVRQRRHESLRRVSPGDRGRRHPRDDHGADAQMVRPGATSHMVGYCGRYLNGARSSVARPPSRAPTTSLPSNRWSKRGQ